MDARGNLYGDTSTGGGTGCTEQLGCGTVYELNRKGTMTLLHSLLGPDGAYPYASLMRDAAGNLYGTTYGGGQSGCGDRSNGCGTVFRAWRFLRT